MLLRYIIIIIVVVIIILFLHIRQYYNAVIKQYKTRANCIMRPHRVTQENQSW